MAFLFTHMYFQNKHIYFQFSLSFNTSANFNFKMRNKTESAH